MTIIKAIIEGTFREAIAKKTLVGFMILSAILILITFLIFQNEVVQSGMKESHEVGAADMAAGLMNTTVLDVTWSIISVNFFIFTMCLGVFSTASFITSLMEKGTIDLLLSKPVHRWQYLMGRYIGALAVMLIEIAFFVLGMWVVISLSVGKWNMNFPFSIIHMMLGFAGLYSVVVFVSVLSRSSLLAIIATIGLAFISMLATVGRWLSDNFTVSEKTVWGYLGDGIYYLFPQVTDMGFNMSYAILGKDIQWTSIGLITVLTALYLSLSVYFFNKKEF
jgi:ABC-type transport system involved in multi-copper enzyme maturation permease subunit